MAIKALWQIQLSSHQWVQYICNSKVWWCFQCLRNCMCFFSLTVSTLLSLLTHQYCKDPCHKEVAIRSRFQTAVLWIIKELLQNNRLFYLIKNWVQILHLSSIHSITIRYSESERRN